MGIFVESLEGVFLMMYFLYVFDNNDPIYDIVKKKLWNPVQKGILHDIRNEQGHICINKFVWIKKNLKL